MLRTVGKRPFSGPQLRRGFAAAVQGGGKVDQRQLALQREREQKKLQLKRAAVVQFENMRTQARIFRNLPHTMDVPTAMRYIRAAEVGEPGHESTVSLQITIVAERGAQAIKGAFKLPHPIKEERLCVLTGESELAEQARKAGASIVGSDDIIAQIRDDTSNFLSKVDRIYATPDIMFRVNQIARILGPKGMMPRASRGTVITEVYDAIMNAKGETSYNQVKDTLMVPVGRASFSDKMVVANILTAVNKIRDQLQAVASAKKGQIGKVLLTSTRSPSISIVV